MNRLMGFTAPPLSAEPVTMPLAPAGVAAKALPPNLEPGPRLLSGEGGLGQRPTVA